MEQNEIKKKKWGIGKVILIILFLPFFAIWYVWQKTDWSNNKKVLATVGIVVFLIIGMNLSNESGKSTGNAVSKNNESKEIQESVNINEQTPPKELSEEEQIKQSVNDEFKGKNTQDKNYIRKIEVIKQIDGGWGVFVEYNANDNLTTNLRKKGIELDMSKIYTALYTSDKDIQTASVTAYFPLVDKYGNTEDGVVYKTMLDKSEAEKVNWNTDKSYLGLEILPNVWETTLIHSEFR